MSELTEERVREIAREEARKAMLAPYRALGEAEVAMSPDADIEHPLFDKWAEERRELSTNMKFREWLWMEENRDMLIPTILE